MQKNKTINLATVVALSASALLLGGCAVNRASYSGDIRDETVVGEVVAVQPAPSETAPAPDFSSPRKAATDERGAAGSWLANREIYFDLDQSVVKEEFLPIIDAHVDYLLRHPNRGVLLAGNTDNRGTNEYNLALGQRRADAVRDLMLAGGVSGVQLEAISFGEENPAVLGDNEAAWAANRRVEIRYTDE